MEGFDRNEILTLLNDIFSYKAIDANSIPDIDLYMDQVTTLIESKMNSLKRKHEDKMLTKTMINNYTKEGILFSPVMKKYTKNHIKMLVMIYYFKQVLSMNDIKAILKPVSDKHMQQEAKTNTGKGGDNKASGKKTSEPVQDDFIEKLYDTFIYLEEFERNNFQDTMNDMMDRIEKVGEDLTNRSSVFMMIVDLVLQAQVRKTMAEKLIDTYFAIEEDN